MSATNGQAARALDRRERGRDRTNARGEATRELILLTAERLFAERGIEAVPLSDIGIAANQKNNYAVQYHFGDRENLVYAIVAYRAESINEVNAGLLADLFAAGRNLTPTDFVRTIVTALAVNLSEESHFLPFISRFIVERGGYSEIEETVRTGFEVTLRKILLGLLPDLTETMLRERWEILFTSAVHTLARYKVAMKKGVLQTPLEDLLEDLIRSHTALLEAPSR